MDGHLAVLAAGKRGATGLDLLCAAGGRLDAVFALPHLLLAAGRMGVRATVFAAWGEMLVVEDGSREVVGAPGESVSVFPLTGTAEDVTLEGFEYPLGGGRIEAGDTLGFHNEMAGGEARVAVGSGVLLVIHETEPGMGPASAYP